MVGWREWLTRLVLGNHVASRVDLHVREVPLGVVDALLRPVEEKRRARRGLVALQAAPREVLDCDPVTEVEEDRVVKPVPEVHTGREGLEQVREECLGVRRVVVLGGGEPRQVSSGEQKAVRG
jgi:hypothetical protein